MHDSSIRPLAILFDVNETLLDIKPLQKAVTDVLLDEDGAKLWFTTMLQYSLVMTVSDQYASFGDIGAAVLQMLARNRDIALKVDDAKQVLSVIQTLPPHPDVKPALELLKAGGIRLATLTNSSQDVGEAQMRHAGLDGFFERMLSVERSSGRAVAQVQAASCRLRMGRWRNGCRARGVHAGRRARLGRCRCEMGGPSGSFHRARGPADVPVGRTARRRRGRSAQLRRTTCPHSGGLGSNGHQAMAATSSRHGWDSSFPGRTSHQRAGSRDRVLRRARSKYRPPEV